MIVTSHALHQIVLELKAKDVSLNGRWIDADAWDACKLLSQEGSIQVVL